MGQGGHGNVTVQPRIRVLVADDHPLYREALCGALRARPELELIAELADGRAALDAIFELEPDVAVLAVHLPDLGGIEVLHALDRQRSPTHVVFLAADHEGSSVLDAMQQGARGYLPKQWTGERICDAVAAVGRGETVWAPELQDNLAHEIYERHPLAPQPRLTNREFEVLKLTAGGKSATEIGKRLHIGEATVRSHLHNLYAKLDVSDRAAAVAQAMRKGLLE